MAEFKNIKIPCSVFPEKECPAVCPASPLNPDRPQEVLRMLITSALGDLDVATGRSNDINDPEVQQQIFDNLSAGIKVLQERKFGPPQEVVMMCIKRG